MKQAEEGFELDYTAVLMKVLEDYYKQKSLVLLIDQVKKTKQDR